METLKKLLPWNWNWNWRAWLPWNRGRCGEVPVQRMDTGGTRDVRDLVPRLLREPLFPSRLGFEASPLSTWPRVDLEEAADAYTLRADVPGATPGDVQVILRGRDLVLRSEHAEEREHAESGYRWQVRRYGGWHRRLRVPEDVDRDAIEARVDAGVLTVRLPRAAVERKVVPVRAA